MFDETTEPRDRREALRGHDAWARLRFSIIGSLLASPPAKGELRRTIAGLAAKPWKHPISGEPVCFGCSTIERWYYQARNAGQDPVGELRRRVRKDAGRQAAVSSRLAVVIRAQHADHPSWSYQLHFDNLQVVVVDLPELGPLPSYSTIRRYMKANGLVRQRRRKGGDARAPAAGREVRSYEVEYVHGLWHADFHAGSRHVLTRDGKWRKPKMLAVVDDRSRLCCHAQWYLDEEAESFVHGLCQAFQKRGLPRALMTDNGSAMRAAETQRGLLDLGIAWDPTQPYSPHQNAKMEVVWASVEGRLMAMLENEADLTLGLLNEATQAWMELDYNREPHREIHVAPLRRFLDDPQVGRDSPSSEALRAVFRAELTRIQRRSDGTVLILGKRFELPSRLRCLDRVSVRVARWDLGFVHVVDPKTGVALARIWPLDKERNAEGLRRGAESIDVSPSTSAQGRAGMAPLLRKLMAEYSATGIPPAYLPKHDLDTTDEGTT
jgi:transposase InsO family protein